MSSSDPESNPRETSPLPETSKSNDEDLSERTTRNTDSKHPNGKSKERLSTWFWAALGSGIISIGFLIPEMLMASHGWEQYHYRDWSLQNFQQVVFWTSLISIVLNVANLVRLRHAREPLSSLLNVAFLAALTFTFIFAVAELVEDYSFSSFFCRHERRPEFEPFLFSEDLPNNCMCRPSPEFEPRLFSEGLPKRGMSRPPPDTLEDCLEWFPKMQIIVVLLFIFTALHGLILGRLLLAILEDMFVSTARFFKSNDVGSRLSSGKLSFEVSFTWGGPTKVPTPTQHQPGQEEGSTD